MSFSIAGKTAIVTGAANGIGLAVARHFSDHGANVVFADMDEARLIEELGAAAVEDSNVRYFAGDLRERLTMTNLLSATIDAFDRVDILVNGSRQVMVTDPLSSDDDTLNELLQQNLMTSYRMSQLVARRLISQAEKSDETNETAGCIINLSSIASRRTHGDLLAYSVSTAALDQMTRSLAVALAKHHIRVNAVSFGSVMSASLKSAINGDESFRDDITSNTPLGRIAAAAEVAEAAQFLASEAASFMTGQIVTLDGGRTLMDPVTAPAH
jgi:7-alpha-hydroxysteroid dehydrogenase